MKGPVKAIILAVAVLVLVGGAFWGGTLFQGSQTQTGFPAGGGAQGMRGGAMPGLTEEEQAEIEDMTDEERQAWLQENMGDGAALGGPTRGGNLEGEVIEVAEDSITISLESGSQTVYTDENTVIAYVEGAGDLAAGSTVIVIAEPVGGPTGDTSTSSITTASLVVVE
ncbi:MAG: hypothetical protein Q7W51_00385 [Coriobacteriia bacterium]|nr:hypothetical protein [Coriobacteriia bacterium]